MASFTKRSGSWRVIVRYRGLIDSGTFPTKAEAQAWAVEAEAAMRKQKATGIVAGKTGA